MHIEPTSDNVLIRAVEEKVTPGGVILVSSSRRERARGVVIAVGPGRYEHGQLLPVRIKTGDTVLYRAYDEQKITIGKDEHYLVDEDDVLGVIRD